MKYQRNEWFLKFNYTYGKKSRAILTLNVGDSIAGVSMQHIYVPQKETALPRKNNLLFYFLPEGKKTRRKGGIQKCR